MKRSLAIALIAVSALLCAAEKKTDTSGTWRINAEKSDFGGMPAPETLMWVVKDTEDKIVIDEHGGDGNVLTLTFARGGKESVNRIGNTEMRTKLTEDNGALKEDTVITTSEGNTMTRISTTRVSDDGKVMTQTLEMKGPQGTVKRTLVFDKK